MSIRTFTETNIIQQGREIIPPFNFTPHIPITTDIEKKTPYNNGITMTLPQCQLGIPVISWIDFFAADNITKILTIAECLITVTQTPKIVKSYSQGKDGSVKTYVGMDDYQINIDGYLFNLTDVEGVYPNQKMTALQNILTNQGANFGIKIFSPYLQLFGDPASNTQNINGLVSPAGIQYIVITNIDCPQEIGGYSQQKFTIEAISDSQNDANILYSPYIP